MKQYLVPGLFLAGTLFFAYLYVFGPVGQEAPISTDLKSGGIPFGKVEQYRQETAIKMDIMKQQAEVNRHGDRPELDPSYKKNNDFHETTINGSLGPAARDLEDASVTQPMTLDQRMDQFLAQKQRYQTLEASQKQLFAEKFIEEARKMGFEVKINDNLEVIDVKEIQ